MKFKFFDIEITIKKEYLVICFLILIMILVLWGWYLRDNRVEVFRADEKSYEPKQTGDKTNNETSKQTDVISSDASQDISSEALIKGTTNMPININTADKEMLIQLHGIGEVKANAIIEFREQKGAFKSIEEIKNVKGIGDATFLNLKDKIVVGTEGRKPLKTDLLQ